MEKGNISVQSENIFPIIKRFLYSDHEIFLRELISNAVDATTKVKALVNKGLYKGNVEDLTIEIIVNKKKKTITISDKGLGMSGDETKKYLNQVAFSSASEFLEKFKDDGQSIIGHFGLGFYSAFMVADKVEVNTKSWNEEESAVLWTCEGNPEFSLESSNKKERGTDVILYINKDGEEFLEDNRIQSLLDKYCKFLPVPIKFGTKEEKLFEGEGENKKEKKVNVDNIVNNPNPIWKKQPGDLSDDDYKNFYKELYPFGQPPMFWIHLNIDYPFNLTGILYFPKLKTNFEMEKNKIQLYSNQVYVTDDVKDIVPEFLMLLHGVIDSPDIPLNVSRSYLQGDSNVKKINGYITKKVSEKLSELFKKDRKEFEQKWNDLSPFVKYGIVSDEKFAEKALKFVLFKNVDNEYFTLDEYSEKIKNIQTDKNNKAVHIYTNNKEEHYSFIQSAKSKGYDILLMDNILDNHFIQHLEYKTDNRTFVRIDSDSIDKLVNKEEDLTSVLTEEQSKIVKETFSNQKGNEMMDVEVKGLSADEGPVLITKPEFLRRMKEMQSLQGLGMEGFPDSYQLIVNGNHPMISQKLLNSDKEEQAELAKYLIQMAKLSQNLLKGEDLDLFLKKTYSLIN
jgi:molecular chaperone HtpG